MPLNSHDAAFRRFEREVSAHTAPSMHSTVTSINTREPTVTEFRAVPEALQATVAQLHEVAQTWVTARTALTEDGVDPALFGGNTVPSNNPMLRGVLDRMEQSYAALNDAVQLLKAVAESSASQPGT